MKKQIIALVAIVALFGLAIAAYAYSVKTTTAPTAASCCKAEGDSCPMKGKGHDDKGDHAKMSCCKKHDSDHAKSEDQSKAEAHSCCGCCGDSCPMKKKDGATVMSSDDKSCCDDCACCKGKTEASV